MRLIMGLYRDFYCQLCGSQRGSPGKGSMFCGPLVSTEERIVRMNPSLDQKWLAKHLLRQCLSGSITPSAWFRYPRSVQHLVMSCIFKSSPERMDSLLASVIADTRWTQTLL